MTAQDSQFFESYVPVYDAIPDKWEDARPFLVEQLKKISDGVNIREIGYYLDVELLSGKEFFPSTTELADGGTSQQFRSILRKVVDFGSLPNATTKSVPHGIVFDNNFSLIQMFAAATNPSTMAIPIPFASPLNPDVQLSMDPTNVTIVTGANLTAYTRVYVTIEYIQEI